MDNIIVSYVLASVHGALPSSYDMAVIAVLMLEVFRIVQNWPLSSDYYSKKSYNDNTQLYRDIVIFVVSFFVFFCFGSQGDFFSSLFPTNGIKSLFKKHTSWGKYMRDIKIDSGHMGLSVFICSTLKPSFSC